MVLAKPPRSVILNHMASHQPKVTEKPCEHCGKPIQWTRNTATIWESIKYCDNACKRQANRQLPRHLDENANLPGPPIKAKRK